jgi:hypothetical protein
MSFSAGSKDAKNLSFSPHNPNLLMTNDSDEIIFWDIRNPEKRLLAIKGSGFDQVEFCKYHGDMLLISKEHDIQVFDLKNYKTDLQSESSCVTVD